MKRFLDILFLIMGLVILIPTVVLISLLIIVTMGTPVLYKQIRPGLHAKPFTFYKFRTMSNIKGKDGKLLPDGQRVTKWGKYLRKTSLDELPSLWNVLKGDMSLVGPRPLMLEYLPLYSPEQARRHEVNPGITGWAQINGRNAILWEEKFKLDVSYVDKQSMIFDIKILLITILKVLKQEGINQKEDVTMEPFLGN